MTADFVKTSSHILPFSYNYPPPSKICRGFAMQNYYFYLPLRVKIHDDKKNK